MRKKYRIEEGKLTPVANGGEAGVEVFCNPTEAEKKYLVETLKVDEHTLASALDPDELSRLEQEPEHFVIIYNRPKSYAPTKRKPLGIGSAGLFIYKDRMVIIQSDDDSSVDQLVGVRVLGYPTLALKLLNVSVVHYQEHLKIINRISDEIQDKLALSMENKYLLKMFELQRSMVYYQVSINANQALIEKLKLNSAKIAFTPEQVEMLDDLSIENTQCGKQAEINSNILAGLMDARASIVNNNLNILMKMLNLITIGIMVPTLVVSAFSMNVPIPLSSHPYAFWYVMALALTSVLCLVVYLRMKKW
jgi:magnesium transporter